VLKHVRLGRSDDSLVRQPRPVKMAFCLITGVTETMVRCLRIGACGLIREGLAAPLMWSPENVENIGDGASFASPHDFEEEARQQTRMQDEARVLTARDPLKTPTRQRAC
jgi:hypothetical protein